MMALQISVFLLSILFTAGHSLYCYECMDLAETCVKKMGVCPWGASKCVSSTIVVEVGGFKISRKVNGCSLGCESGSINLGTVKSTYSCCNTNFCNARDAQDPNTIVRNGKTCYYCDGESCSNTLSCSGTEDRCITAKTNSGGPPTVVKGCASNAICGSKSLANGFQDASCCKGNLCNGDESVSQSVTQSFMHNGDRSVTQSFIRSVTQSFVQNVTQSFMYNGDKRDIQSVTQSFVQNVTQSFVYDNAEIAKHNNAKSAMHSDYKSVKKSFMNNDANSVTQSFLFLCCSLFSFILLH